MKPAISIIVPVYNAEKELERCINSIQNQTITNIEIIIVDDGSTDNCPELIRRIAKTDPRIVPVFKENGGVTLARLSGVKIAKGNWIGFVDSDDEVESIMFEKLLFNAEKNHVDISHCGYQMLFPDGRRRSFYNTGISFKRNKIEGLRDLLEGNLVEPGLWNKLFKRELFVKLMTAGIDCSIKINEDLLMNYYLFNEAAYSYFEDCCLYHYIVRDNSASHQSLNKNRVLDPINVKQIIVSDCSPELLKDANTALINTAIHQYGLLVESKDFLDERQKIHALICENKHMIKFLPKKTAVQGWLIVLFPIVYSVLYPFYTKFLQDRKYC